MSTTSLLIPEFPSSFNFQYPSITPMSKSFIPSGSLRPVLPQHTGRYEVGKKVQRQLTVIEPGMFLSTQDASPTYLPPQWSALIHPEGNLYFHRNTGLSIVTECNMYDPLVGEQICVWSAIAEKQAMDKGFFLANMNTVELFLKLAGENCSYYFVDRATKATFWLEPYDTDDLCLNDTVSTSHLRILLEGQYWNHIENFCMHFGGLPQKDLDNLILVFSHALADTLTSTSSTFPYEAPACEKFLNLLTASRDRIHEGYTVCYVARLWGVIAYNRYETHYGQEQSRLCRDTSILVDEYQEPKWIQSLVSSITLRTSVPYAKRLNELFVDSFVYGWDWDAFMSSTVNAWRMTAVQSTVLLFLQIACFFLPGFPLLFYSSTSLAALSIFTSCLLVYKHQPLSNSGAGPGHDYLTAVCSRSIKFQGVAFAYALPKTFFLGGLFASFSQVLYILCHYISSYFICLSGAVLVSILLITHLATSDIQIPRPPLLPNWKKEEASMA